MATTLIRSILMFGAALAFARATELKSTTFATPEEARDALVQAAGKGLDEVKALFGPGSEKMLHTGDPVEDKQALERFNKLAAEKTTLEIDEFDPNRVTLSVGTIEWPLAVPLVRKDGHWQWDVKEGTAEVRRRVIGGNELDAIEICHGYVEAQQRYAETDWDGNGVFEYAKKIVSNEGKKDGLYWPGDDSPVAAGFAKAVAQGYELNTGQPKPFHGYFFKVLLSQGPAAVGGAQDYVVHGLMIGGFALVAWPAEYGVSGIMTFIVNQDGIVYEKDLGPRTATAAKGITVFNPDSSWRPSPVTDPMS